MATTTLSLHPVPLNEVKGLLEDAARDVPYTNLDIAAASFLVGYRLGTIYLGNAKAAREAGKEDEANAWLRQIKCVSLSVYSLHDTIASTETCKQRRAQRTIH